MPSTVKDIVRDFTEEMKEKLENAIEHNTEINRAAYSYNLKEEVLTSVIMPIIGVPKVLMMTKLLSEIDTKKAEALNQLTDVFRDVHGVDVKYRIKINSISDQLICYKRTLSDLASLIQPDATGECPLTSPGFMAGLAKIGLGAVDYWIDQLMPKTQDRGKVVTEPDWDMIEEWFRTPPDELTKAQLKALAAVYLRLSNDEDTERFLNCGYVYDAAAPPTVAFTMTKTLLALDEIVEGLALSMTLAAESAQKETGATSETAKMVFERMQMMQIVCSSEKIIDWNYTEYPETDIGAFLKNIKPVRISREYDNNSDKCEKCKAYLENKCEESQECEKILVLTTTSHVLFPETESPPPANIKIRIGNEGTKMLDGASYYRSETENYILKQVVNFDEEALKIIANEALGNYIGDFPMVRFALGPVRSAINAYAEQLKSMSEAKDYWSAGEKAKGLDHLFAQINYSEVGGKIIEHAIQFDSVAGIHFTEGFLNSFNNENSYGFKISVDEFRLIMQNGKPPSKEKNMDWVWKALGPEETSLDREQQLFVYDKYIVYKEAELKRLILENAEKNDSDE